MNHYCIYQILLVLFLLITLITGRALYYDQLDEDDKTKLSSNEDNGKILNEKFNQSILLSSILEIEDLDTKLSKWVNYQNDDSQSYDSYEERKFHQRGLFSSSRASHTISTHTRQAIIDILQKAYDNGWRPSLKHYIPATRFGRHRR